MTKSRISISLGPEDAARPSRVAAALADIDAAIAAAEADAEHLTWRPDDDADPAEVARVQAEITAARARSAARRRDR
jgi:hypothetical protein